MDEKAQTQINFEEVDRWLEEAYPQMELDLMQLLAIPSEKGPAENGAPFGRPIAEALDYTLELAKGFELATDNVDGYVGFADLRGQTEEQVGVLSHLDVVPANPKDWQFGPFSPVVRDNRIYGRGSLDDKGPLIASLYAGMALARCGIELNKTVRFIFGCNEESGMSCIHYYLQKYAPPSCGFSPDGIFPLVIGEKGMGRFALSANWQADAGSARLKLQSLSSGTVLNIVPDYAEAVFLVEREFYFEGADLPGLTIAREGNLLRISAGGKAAHASTPEQGENALVKLLQFLARQDFYPRGAKQYITTLAELFADTCYGTTLGVADEDSRSKTTVIPSILQMDENGGILRCDMRFTLSRKAEFFRQKLENIAAKNGLNLENWIGIEPMFAGENSPLAGALLQVYRDYTGDMSEPVVMGGGTYAKTMPNFLAYGPAFSYTAPLAHQADEYLERKEFLDSAKIYARAIYALAK